MRKLPSLPLRDSLKDELAIMLAASALEPGQLAAIQAAQDDTEDKEADAEATHELDAMFVRGGDEVDAISDSDWDELLRIEETLGLP